MDWITHNNGFPHRIITVWLNPTGKSREITHTAQNTKSTQNRTANQQNVFITIVMCIGVHRTGLDGCGLLQTSVIRLKIDNSARLICGVNKKENCHRHCNTSVCLSIKFCHSSVCLWLFVVLLLLFISFSFRPPFHLIARVVISTNESERIYNKHLIARPN